MHLLNHHIYRLKFTELNEMYFSMSLRTFAFSLIGIFIPIYFYKLGFSIQQIFSFFILFFGVMAFCEIFSGKLVSRYGAKHIMSLSFPLYIAYIFLLLSLPQYHFLFYPASITVAIANSLFWISYHTDFSKAKHTDHIGKELSKIYIISALIGAMGPFVGGYIATFFGIQYVLGMIIIILFLAILPLFKTQEITKIRPVTFKNFNPKRILADLFSYGGFGIVDAAHGVIWPFFIFLLVAQYVHVGLIATAGLVTAVIVMFKIGRLIDHYRKHFLLKIGIFANFASFILRTLAGNFLQSLVINILADTTFVISRTPFFACYYIHADEKPRIEYIIAMEIAVDFFRLLFFSMLLFLSFPLTLKAVLIAGLLLGAAGSLLMETMKW